MAKSRNPITASEQFGVPADALLGLGVLDITLTLDTALFIDPMLLQTSAHPEFRDAHNLYEAHFAQVIRLLIASQRVQDPAWSAALRLMQFPEIKGTCLGYGAGSIDGRGFTGRLSERTLEVATEIVNIGIRDPDLFPAMALFEPHIGPDRISDMVTNIAFPSVAAFNLRVLRSLNLRGEPFRRHRLEAEFLVNPLDADRTPVIFIPTDVLRELPIVKDWDSVADAADHNDDLREAVNTHIGELWAQRARRSKERLKAQALADRAAFEALLRAIKTADAQPYDAHSDPEGLIVWAALGRDYARQYPFQFALARDADLPTVFDVVKAIVTQFRHLIEHMGLNKELYRESGRPRHESTAQRLFFAVAYAYCKANNVDISPEIDTGTGKIDFKLSVGLDERVLVEIKLSTNPGVLSGYATQLEVYRTSQETVRAVFLVIDVGRMGKKAEDLIQMRNDATERGDPLSELEFVDGTIKPTASKR